MVPYLRKWVSAAPAMVLPLVLSIPAMADVPPPNDCDTPGQGTPAVAGQPCNTAPPDYMSEGICVATTCQGTPNPTVDAAPPSYACVLCLPADAGTTNAALDATVGPPSVVDSGPDLVEASTATVDSGTQASEPVVPANDSGSGGGAQADNPSQSLQSSSHCAVAWVGSAAPASAPVAGMGAALGLALTARRRRRR
jgi:hypothetical protein